MAGKVAYLGTTVAVSQLAETPKIKQGLAATGSEIPGIEAQVWETEVQDMTGKIVGYHGVICGTSPSIDGARGVAYLALDQAHDAQENGSKLVQQPFFGESWAAKIFES